MQGHESHRHFHRWPDARQPTQGRTVLVYLWVQRPLHCRPEVRDRCDQSSSWKRSSSGSHCRRWQSPRVRSGPSRSLDTVGDSWDQPSSSYSFWPRSIPSVFCAAPCTPSRRTSLVVSFLGRFCYSGGVLVGLATERRFSIC